MMSLEPNAIKINLILLTGMLTMKCMLYNTIQIILMFIQEAPCN